LKVRGVAAHDLPVHPRTFVARSGDAPTSGEEERGGDFDAIYETWFHDVSRWIRALGGLDADLDDLTQEVFIVVRRKLALFDGANLPGWLYCITARTVSDQRRRAWWKSLFRRRRDVDLDLLPSPAADPAEQLEQVDARRTLQRLLAKMSEKRRVAFVLFEVEGYSGEEIADLLDIPIATVWTRLHHARRDFLELLREHQRKEGA
jgi:RNA polymerase sigma-70 factor (ECF subfamily)